MHGFVATLCYIHVSSARSFRRPTDPSFDLRFTKCSCRKSLAYLISLGAFYRLIRHTGTINHTKIETNKRRADVGRYRWSGPRPSLTESRGVDTTKGLRYGRKGQDTHPEICQSPVLLSRCLSISPSLSTSRNSLPHTHKHTHTNTKTHRVKMSTGSNCRCIVCIRPVSGQQK